MNNIQRGKNDEKQRKKQMYNSYYRSMFYDYINEFLFYVDSIPVMGYFIKTS